MKIELPTKTTTIDIRRYMPEDFLYLLYVNLKEKTDPTLGVLGRLAISTVDPYLSNFMNDKLVGNRSNYLTFINQKQILLNILNDNFTKYGNSFWLEHEMNLGNMGFLFVHTILAFDKTNYLEICKPEPDAVTAYDVSNTSRYRRRITLTKKGIGMIEDNRRLKQTNPRELVTKIEVVKMPTINTKNVDDNILIKKNRKRVTLPKFPRTEWSKVRITFLDERNVLLFGGQDAKPSSFIGLGCDDGRTDRPDKSWGFLLDLAVGNGQTIRLQKGAREKQKKQKQKITDLLRKLFRNDTDPFEAEEGGIYKAKFNIEYTTGSTHANPPDTRYSDLNEVQSEMTRSREET